MKDQKNKKSKKLRIGKIVIKDIKRFLISVSILVVSIVLICVLISNLADKKTENTSGLSSTNISKYERELLKKYEETGMKDLFLNDYDSIQNAVGLYIINNSTMDDDSINILTTSINQMLSQNKWPEELGINIPETWNGTWSVDGEGILNFKFESKNIEPKWVLDEDMVTKIVKN